MHRRLQVHSAIAQYRDCVEMRGWLRTLVLASGLTAEQVLEELSDVVIEDIQAALRYAGQSLDHSIVAA